MNSPETSATTQIPPPQKRGRWVVVLLGTMLLTMMGMFYLYLQIVDASLWGFGPREMVIAQYTPKDVVGDLGGMKVVIPRGVAELVEYDDDPAWGEKRKGPRPVRTSESKLASFGFYVRYPDMATFADPDMRKTTKNMAPANGHSTMEFVAVIRGSSREFHRENFILAMAFWIDTR